MPGIDARSPAIYELVEEGSGVENLATGFTFTEGPIWHPTEHYLLFSDMPGDVRRKYTPGSGVVEVLRPARKCNGMTYDHDLNLLVCEHVTSQLVRERPDGPETAGTAGKMTSPLGEKNRDPTRPFRWPLLASAAGRRTRAGQRHANVEVALDRGDLEAEQEKGEQLKHDVDHRRHLHFHLVGDRARGAAQLHGVT